jgi:hypothetical protein
MRSPPNKRVRVSREEPHAKASGKSIDADLRGTIRFTPEKPIPQWLIKAILRVRAQELQAT